MTELTLVIGSEARTADDKISGYVKAVVVDRGTRTVTHLVVEPKGRDGLARLVRLDDHVDAQDSTIRLGYTAAEFKNLTAAEDALGEVFNSGPVELISEGWRPADDEPVVDGSKISPARAMFRGEIDLVPVLLPAEEEEHRGDHVHATDGEIGQLRALLVDPGTHQVTHVHVRLKEGLLRRRQDVAIPSGSVSGFAGGVHLSISRQQVAELAHGDIGHPGG
jgi:hypothetical protein